MRVPYAVLLVILLVGCGPGTSDMEEASPDLSEQAIRATAEAFTAAIVSNDSTGAAGLLAENVRIVEGGGIETKAEYLSHHFHSDGAFLSAMNRESISSEIRITGSVAWSVSTSRLSGNYRDRDIDMTSAELMVLAHGADGWKIQAVHWSSRSNSNR